MPPKKPDASKKTQEKVKAKIVEDKTFGLKNKKGAKQQKFIQQVQKQVSNKLSNNPRALDPVLEREKKREEEKKKKEELTQLFKPVVTQQVPKGVDPKSVVCAYFKQNLCQKGDKCKFSHDLAVERKSEKRNIYEDTRDQDGMENWDDAKLEDVVNQKHGEDNIKKTNTTQIVCKYFIEAVENKTYGWFWSCPNGEKCMYRHALPPGFTLKSEMKKKDQEEEISLEMLIEKERASLGTRVTKVTLESFIAWKKRKLTEKKDEAARKEEKKRADYKLGFQNGLTGRDLFTFNPDLIGNDDEDAENDIDYRHRAEDDDETTAGFQIRKLDINSFANEASEVDNTGTIATDDRFAYLESMLKEHDAAVLKRQKEREAEAEAAAAAAAEAGTSSDLQVEEVDEEEGEEEEGGEENEGVAEQDDDLTEEEHKNSIRKILNDKTNSDTKDTKNPLLTKTDSKVEIDESLFNLEDLADIQDELEELDLN